MKIVLFLSALFLGGQCVFAYPRFQGHESFGGGGVSFEFSFLFRSQLALLPQDDRVSWLDHESEFYQVRSLSQELVKFCESRETGRMIFVVAKETWLPLTKEEKIEVVDEVQEMILAKPRGTHPDCQN
ncbi:hypothetical protein AZI86_08975 [Bdellovibrio bacteriovorus]|uniref:Uncharacterized protein n=1 Tax=Bdellovibrio bacteriovorus TaxID=959 RepID=A0A150WRJ2_BDEBC|nr:hypothetical protein [Bdellovibrio bacteriovorus]KYG67133.1 hypothetical protein AZI86_08975 [Bdellovibrio bacteriovorus]